MKRIIVLVLSILFLSNLFAQETIKLYGKASDFNAIPLDSVSVILKNDKFEDMYKSLSDKDGNFSMNVPKGTYFCLYAIKLSDYGKTKLEYWAWNIPLYKDMNINPQYERMEIYGLNAFEPKVTPYQTYMIYFRPMSLTKSLRLAHQETKKKLEEVATKNHDTIDIAPEKITSEELTVKMNDMDTKILNIQKTVEYARGIFMYGYMIQILKPKEEKMLTEQYDKISIKLHSRETNEDGKGEVFIRKRE